MASIFQKADPKDSSTKRWMGKVKINGEWKAFSLRLKAVPGTKREAQARTDQLQTEILAGALSEETRAWLGESVGKLEMAIGRGISGIGERGVQTWKAALDGWCATFDAKKVTAVPEGRVKVDHQTNESRYYKVKQFVAWAVANDVPFMAEPFTDTIRRYIGGRVKAGIKPSTLWNADYSMLCCWGEWMSRRKLCEPIDRERIREAMPERPVVQIDLPTWRQDLATIKFFHAVRKYGEWAGVLQGKGNWKTYRSRQAAWHLVLVVRGLGCRPSEATALSWETVDTENWEKVRFVYSKNRRARLVPISMEWVKSGLKELWEWQGKPDRGPVCRTWKDEHWRDDAASTNLIRRVCLEHKMRPIKLKEMEKLQIAQLIRMGFPPHVVALWSDHTLSVQEKHYYEGDSYLPPEDGYDFGEFGALSDYGKKTLVRMGAFAKDLGLE